MSCGLGYLDSFSSPQHMVTCALRMRGTAPNQRGVAKAWAFAFLSLSTLFCQGSEARVSQSQKANWHRTSDRSTGPTARLARARQAKWAPARTLQRHAMYMITLACFARLLYVSLSRPCTCRHERHERAGPTFSAPSASRSSCTAAVLSSARSGSNARLKRVEAR